MAWLRRILVHVCSILLATPVGWCCWMPTARAEEKPEPPTCPHCVTKEKQTPAKPTETPTRRTCCCESQPALISTSELAGKDVTPTLPALLTLAVLPIPDAGLDIALDHSVAPPPTPRLHLLHCVWIC